LFYAEPRFALNVPTFRQCSQDNCEMRFDSFPVLRIDRPRTAATPLAVLTLRMNAMPSIFAYRNYGHWCPANSILVFEKDGKWQN